MSYTMSDLESAIDKLGMIDLSDAEIEALADVLANAPEVDGFAARPEARGWILLQSLRPDPA